MSKPQNWAILAWFGAMLVLVLGVFSQPAWGQDASANPAPVAAKGEVSQPGVSLIYVESPALVRGSTQRIAVICEDGSPQLERALITLRAANGNATQEVASTQVMESVALAEWACDESMELGVWRVTGVTLEWRGREATTFDATAEDSDLTFELVASASELPAPMTSTVEEAPSAGNAESAQEVNYLSLNETNTLVSDGELSEAVAVAEEGTEDAVSTLASGQKVIALDPGHGGGEAGASGFGLHEEEINWIITKYAEERLAQLGVPTYRTRNYDEAFSIRERCERAVDNGAIAIVSFHINSTDSDASGAMILIPNSSSFNYYTHEEGYDFARKLEPKLEALGLDYLYDLIRDYGQGWGEGVYPDGSDADYYGICRYARRLGITGVIIEHAFISNYDDAQLLQDDAFLKELGYADAQAIYEQWGSQVGAPHDLNLENAPENGVHRLYNTYNGDHMFTQDTNEIQDLYDQGWIYENVKWIAPESSNANVWRLYNPYNYEHLYTDKKSEYDALGKTGWQQEGVAWCSAEKDGVPVWRMFNPYETEGTHLFTTDEAERNSLEEQGWQNDGIVMYAESLPVPPEPPQTSPQPGDDSLAPDVPPASETEGTPIMGQSVLSQEALRSRFAELMAANGKPYPEFYASKGAPTPEAFVDVLWAQASSEGVRPDVLLAQVIWETGWLQFGGDVVIEQCNFGGIGATDNTHGRESAWFEDVAQGLLAQSQHLKAYACEEPLTNPQVDPRFHLVTRGCAPNVEDLSGRWATGAGYGEGIASLIREWLS